MDPRGDPCHLYFYRCSKHHRIWALPDWFQGPRWDFPDPSQVTGMELLDWFRGELGDQFLGPSGGWSTGFVAEPVMT